MITDALNTNSAYGWLLTPATNLVSFIVDEMIIAAVTERSMRAISLAPNLLLSAKENIVPGNTKLLRAIEWYVDATRSDTSFAQDEINNDFQRVRSHHIVAIWAAIETTIEHTLLNHIRRADDLESLLIKSSDKLSLKSIDRKNKSERAILSNWERSLNIQNVIDRQIKMLSDFNVLLEIGSEQKKILSGLAALRDAIQHNAGFLDDRFFSKRPNFPKKVGDRISFSFDEMKMYFDTASDLSQKLLEAAINKAKIEN